MAPTVVIVPGFWLGLQPYELLVNEMQKAAPGLTDFVYAPLVSTGMRSPGNPTMYDDAIGIREVIRPLVEAGKRLVLVGHSAGAFLSGMATEGLEVGEEVSMKSGGGVERFVFIAGGILPVGAPHPEMTMLDMNVEVGRISLLGALSYTNGAHRTARHNVAIQTTSYSTMLTKMSPPYTSRYSSANLLRGGLGNAHIAGGRRFQAAIC